MHGEGPLLESHAVAIVAAGGLCFSFTEVKCSRSKEPGLQIAAHGWFGAENPTAGRRDEQPPYECPGPQGDGPGHQEYCPHSSQPSLQSV